MSPPDDIYKTRDANAVSHFNALFGFFKNSFFPTKIEWDKPDPNIRDCLSLNMFKKKLISFIRLVPNSIFKCHNSKVIIIFTRLKLGLSYLCQNEFKHSFQDALNPICGCSKDIGTKVHHLLHCCNYSNERLVLLCKLRSIESQILKKINSKIS